MSNSNKPAFPCRAPAEFKTMPNGLMHQEETMHEGLTIRDYFAAKAMDAILHKYFNVGETAESLIEGCEVMAALCYDIADAMLKERDK